MGAFDATAGFVNSWALPFPGPYEPCREYHPLRHDKRLQVAVLRLRWLIEADPSRPARLVTTEEGYALGTAEPIRRITPRHAAIVWQ